VVNLKNKRPVFVPDRFQAEIEKFSKAALMDMVWDLCAQTSLNDPRATDSIMAEVRRVGKLIMHYRTG
jgi:hypothetical protein